MSDYVPVKYVNIVIRRPQYGKTSICMETIKRQRDKVHIIITMNTLKSNEQFFSRCEKVFSEKSICIFNSKQTSNILEVKNQIVQEGKNIVILCAHYKRFRNSIHGLLDLLEDSRSFDKKVIIHIDEMHAYINKNRPYIEDWNEKDIVESITGYSATPFSIWGKGLWENIYVIDTTECDIGTEDYYGVKDVKCNIFTNIENNIPLEISDFTIDVTTNVNKGAKWFTKEKSAFDCGDELSFLNYVDSVIKHWKKNGIVSDDKFSYNFIPGYKRRVTHMEIARIFTEYYNNAVVFIFNSDAIHGNHYLHDDVLYPSPEEKETSEQIYKVKKDYPNSPFCITGFANVGMSVTLINSKIGNFDNVVFSHEHYINTPDVLYQLCRFPFRYLRWTSEERKSIKDTVVWCKSRKVMDTCLNYERDVTNAERLGGSLRTLQEVTSNEQILKKNIPTYKKHDVISGEVEYCETQEFPVYSESMDETMWNVVKEEYKKFKGKKVSAKSMPKLINGFYHCSTTTNRKIWTHEEISKAIKSFKWHSNFQLTKSTLSYARIYVGYMDSSKPERYTIFLRMMRLKDNIKVRNHLENKN